jgi:hypothetical protein
MHNDDIPNFHSSTGESIVRACVTSIAGLNPVTSAIAAAYFQLMDDKRWEYVREFFINVRTKMIEHEQKINELSDKTDPDEILNLMFVAIDNVQFEYQKTRRMNYANLFVNSILIGNKFNFDEKKCLFSFLVNCLIQILAYWQNFLVI